MFLLFCSKLYLGSSVLLCQRTHKGCEKNARKLDLFASAGVFSLNILSQLSMQVITYRNSCVRF